jgi:hypothetical protein
MRDLVIYSLLRDEEFSAKNAGTEFEGLESRKRDATRRSARSPVSMK